MSVSVIWFAATVTVASRAVRQVDIRIQRERSAGEALGANACGEPHSSANALALAVTLSLKLMTTFEFTATLIAAFAGVVLMTVGAASIRSSVVKKKTMLDAI